MTACFNSDQEQSGCRFAPSCAEVRYRKLGRLNSEMLGVKRCTEGTRFTSGSVVIAGDTLAARYGGNRVAPFC